VKCAASAVVNAAESCYHRSLARLATLDGAPSGSAGPIAARLGRSNLE
jgi:hypothetical protein